jgi:uncharacterized protein YacL (UPF0231 family)
MNKIEKETGKLKVYFGHEIKKVAEHIEDEIKENTELAEHETGIHNVKKDAKSIYNKIKETL